MRNSSVALRSDEPAMAGPEAAAQRIRAVLQAHGRLGRDAGTLADDDDLYAAGMTSLSSVNVMLALEGEFNIEFPDQMLNRSVFSSVAAIESALRKISEG